MGFSCSLDATADDIVSQHPRAGHTNGVGVQRVGDQSCGGGMARMGELVYNVTVVTLYIGD